MNAAKARPQSLQLIRLSLMAGVLIFGAVIFFITGQGQWYALGLLVMASSFLLLPPGAPATGSFDAHGSSAQRL